jgi:mono/diheme cytochrome c family protein
MSAFTSSHRFLLAVALACAGVVASGCRQDMHDQPKYKVNGWSNFFADHRNNRPLVPNTVARGRLYEDDLLYRGRVDGKLAEVYPMPITAAVLERGRQRYAIYCQPCHSPAGDGNGIAVQRGMKRPPSYHIERLQKSPPGYIYDVITNGFGSMYDYKERIGVEDRWAIVAYVQTLQSSQNTSFDQLSPVEKDLLTHEQPKKQPTEHEHK